MSDESESEGRKIVERHTSDAKSWVGGGSAPTCICYNRKALAADIDAAIDRERQRAEAAEAKIARFIWAEENPDAYVTHEDAAKLRQRAEQAERESEQWEKASRIYQTRAEGLEDALEKMERDRDKARDSEMRSKAASEIAEIALRAIKEDATALHRALPNGWGENAWFPVCDRLIEQEACLARLEEAAKEWTAIDHDEDCQWVTESGPSDDFSLCTCNNGRIAMKLRAALGVRDIETLSEIDRPHSEYLRAALAESEAGAERSYRKGWEACRLRIEGLLKAHATIKADTKTTAQAVQELFAEGPRNLTLPTPPSAEPEGESVI